MQSSSGEKLALRVVGIHEPPQMDSLLGEVAISQRDFDRAFTRPQNHFTFIDGSSKAALTPRPRAVPGREAHDPAEFAEEPRRRLGRS